MLLARLGVVGSGLALLPIVFPVSLSAQGPTTAAVQGTIAADPRSEVTLERATVILTNLPTGHRWRVSTDDGGRYFIDGVPVGGPYAMDVEAAGFRPASRSGLTLGLGQRYVADFVLDPLVVLADAIEVTVARDPLTDAARTGPEHRVGRSTIAHLPVLNRDILALALESPHAKSTVFGLSIAGHNSPYNNFQVDGGVNGNLYGRFSSVPGGLINLVSVPGGGGLRVVPIDAVKEVQVLTSPFDVRQGSFVGGVINVVTESGTNTLSGSGFATIQNDLLVGGESADFTTGQFGGTLGGPILADRLHYFLAADLQSGTIPYGGPIIGADTIGGADSAGVGIRRETATRFQSILRETYGVDAGEFGPVDGRNPAQSLLGKLSWQFGTGNLLEISQTYVHGQDQGLFLDRDAYGNFDLTSADIRFGSTTTATRANWTALLGDRAAAEVIAAWLRIRDFCRPREDSFPFLSVLADTGTLHAGDKFSCGALRGDLDQDALEFTANLTLGFGGHRLTAGTHDELLHFGDPLFPNAAGRWFFDSIDSLAQGIPSFYDRTFPSPLRPEGAVVDFRARQLGFYLQDQWSPVRNLILTIGLRLDVPYFPDRPPENPLLASELGIDNSTIPDGNALWSPRLGFHYDVGGAARTVIRGGIGLFTGRPAYAMIGDPYRSTGMDALFVTCFGDDVPEFTIDPEHQPEACRSGEPGTAPLVSYFDRDLLFPQDLKIAAGIDRRLPGGLVATADLLYSRATQQPHYVDANLLPSTDTSDGEAGRALYGDIDPATGFTSPRRRSSAFGTVIEQTNRSGDESLFLSAQVQGRIRDRVDLNASYGYSNSRDLITLSGLMFTGSGLGLSGDAIASTALDGTFEDRRARPARFDLRHWIRASGTVELPHGVFLSAIYQLASGLPYTFVVEGDANGDGFGEPRFGQQSNDIVYVPREGAPGEDITLVVPGAEDGEWIPAPDSTYARLEEFIRSSECLREQRGTIMRRNSCRNPWRSSLDIRLSKSVLVGRGHRAEIRADVFNVPNLLARDWGLVTEASPFFVEEIPMLRLVGYDAGRDRGTYALALPSLRNQSGNWRVQIGMHYAF
jgi:hypothetical protein